MTYKSLFSFQKEYVSRASGRELAWKAIVGTTICLSIDEDIHMQMEHKNLKLEHLIKAKEVGDKEQIVAENIREETC